MWSSVEPENVLTLLKEPETGSLWANENEATLPGSEAAQLRTPVSPVGAAERLTVPEIGTVVVGDVGVVVVVGVGIGAVTATSSSVVVTVKVWSATGSKLSAELASTTEKVTAVVWSPSTVVSSTPVTITSCGVFQFALVNVTWALSTVTSPVSGEAIDRTTSDVGCESNTTVIVAVVPASETVSVVLEIVKPGPSSSTVVTETVWFARASYELSAVEPAFTANVTVEFWSPSSRLSSTPVTVTVWGVSQSLAVNVSVDLSTVTSPVLLAETSNTTFPEGWESRTTVKVPVVPASETVAVAGVRVKPAMAQLTWLTLRAWFGSVRVVVSLAAKAR